MGVECPVGKSMFLDPDGDRGDFLHTFGTTVDDWATGSRDGDYFWE